jgi:hypothetical protein
MKTTMAACAAAIPTSASLIASTGLFNGVCLHGARNTPSHPPFGQSFARGARQHLDRRPGALTSGDRGGGRTTPLPSAPRPTTAARRSLQTVAMSIIEMEPRPGAIRDRGSLDNNGDCVMRTTVAASAAATLTCASLLVRIGGSSTSAFASPAGLNSKQ